MYEVFDLSEKELRIEIAIVLGLDYANHRESMYEEGYTEDGDGWDGWFCPKCGISESLYNEFPCTPSWTTDIDSVWELEESLSEEEHEEYSRILNMIVNKWFDDSLAEGAEIKHQRFYLLHATPLQRSQAWLTLKWNK